MQGVWDSIPWGNEEIEKLSKQFPDDNLCNLQKRLLKQEQIILMPTRIKPRIITEPEAFTVHGGG